MTIQSGQRDHRIVVGVDGSVPSKAALAWAISGRPSSPDAAAEADLLVIGNRGHGALVEALLGSVGQQCVHHATCPVVVIRGSRRGLAHEPAGEHRVPERPAEVTL
jgi:nucleotide-binding universal stress UspA family protein